MSGVDELVAFLRAALDRDEQVALVATFGPWHVTDIFTDPPACADVAAESGMMITSSRDQPCCTPEDAEHIARFNPKRMLDEVKAKRAILESALAEDHYLNDREWYGCRAVTENPEIDGPGVPTGQPCTCGRDEPIERTACLLAQPYAGQPGWREEWQLSAPA